MAVVVAAVLPRVSDAAVRARLLLASARAGLQDDNSDAVHDALLAARAIAETADTHAVAALLARDRGDVDGAHRHLAAAIAVATGNQRAALRSQQASLTFETGDADVALAQFAAALVDARAVAAAHGADVTVGVTLTNMALVLQACGRCDDANTAFGEALALHRHAGNRRFEGITLGDLGGLALQHERVATALDCFDAATRLVDDVGDTRQSMLLRCSSPCSVRARRQGPRRSTQHRGGRRRTASCSGTCHRSTACDQRGSRQ